MTFRDDYDIIAKYQAWPIGQAVKTLASHAGNSGSIPGWVTKKIKEMHLHLLYFFARPSGREKADNSNLLANLSWGFRFPALGFRLLLFSRRIETITRRSRVESSDSYAKHSFAARFLLRKIAPKFLRARCPQKFSQKTSLTTLMVVCSFFADSVRGIGQQYIAHIIL